MQLKQTQMDIEMFDDHKCQLEVGLRFIILMPYCYDFLGNPGSKFLIHASMPGLINVLLRL